MESKPVVAALFMLDQTLLSDSLVLTCPTIEDRSTGAYVMMSERGAFLQVIVATLIADRNVILMVYDDV